MATGPQYTNLLANDNGFYIMDNTDATLSTGASFLASGITGLIQLTLPSTSGTIALVGGNTTVAADNITPGDASVYITTTSGGVSINTNEGTSLILNYNGTPEVSLGLSTMKLKDNQAYTISHVADGAGDDLTIDQTGGVDASLILQSAGTGADAILLNATAGGIDINSTGFTVDASGTFSIDATATSAANFTHTGQAGSDLTIASTAGSLVLQGGEADSSAIDIRTTNAAGGISIRSGTGGTSIISSGTITIDQTSTTNSLIIQSQGTNYQEAFQIISNGGMDINAALGQAVFLQNYTRYYSIDATLTAATETQIWTTSNLVSNFASDGAIFVKGVFSALCGTSDYAASYEANNVFYWNTASLAAKGGVSGDIIGRGNTANEIAAVSDVAVGVSSTTNEPQILFKPFGAAQIVIQGMVTVTVSLN